MPFNRTQAVLKRVLPVGMFDWLYRVATAGYYARQRIADWWFYNTPKKTPSERWMISTIKEVLPYTMVGRGGLVATYNTVANIEKEGIDGCLVECGVARGGSASLMIQVSNVIRSAINSSCLLNAWVSGQSLDGQSTLSRRKAWLFDSFEGLPEPTTEDGVLRKPQGKDKSSWDLAKGYCLGTQEEVEDLLFNKFRFDRDKVHLVKGWFQDTLPEYREQVEDIAVLRIDGDWYESTKCCLENLYDNVVDGGYVIIDDYALVGCQKAVDEFFRRRGKEMPEVILDRRGGCWFKKEVAL